MSRYSLISLPRRLTFMQTYTGQYWFFVIPEGRESAAQPRYWCPWQASAQRHMRTCPLCLRYYARPYRRIYWRLAWLCSCPDHGVLLEERPRLHLGPSMSEEAQPPYGRPS